MKTLVCNLIAGPGAGKSTLASGLFHELKSRGVNCELAHEWVKQKVWEGSFPAQPQYYIWAKQQRMIEILDGKVDVIITDSPPLLSLYYGEHEPAAFRELVVAYHNKQNNRNYFVDRIKEYRTAGRAHDEQQARNIDAALDDLLHFEFIEHVHIPGNRSSVFVLADVISAVL